MSAPWATVPVTELPIGALNLRTYAPDAEKCVKGHLFESEADCILPEDEDGECWDQFLCRRCVDWMRTYGRGDPLEVPTQTVEPDSPVGRLDAQVGEWMRANGIELRQDLHRGR